jgi:hypothetical protein
LGFSKNVEPSPDGFQDLVSANKEESIPALESPGSGLSFIGQCSFTLSVPGACSISVVKSEKKSDEIMETL